MINAKNEIIIRIIKTGKINLIQRSIGTRLILNIAISPPSVGLTRLVRPSPI